MKRHLLSVAAILVMIVLAFGSMDTSTVNTGGAPSSSPAVAPQSSTDVAAGDQVGSAPSVATSSSTPAPATPTTEKQDTRPTDLVVSDAPAVFAAFDRNEVKADSDMKNKWFAVKGTVDKIGKDILNTPYVALSNGQEYAVFCVQCMFARADESLLSRLSPGQTVVIAGKCKGKMGNVIMDECWIYDEGAADRERARQRAEALRQAAEEQRRQDEQRKAEIEEAKWHTWTTADGKYTVEAKFVQAAGETVSLEKRDGTVIKVEKGRLCDDDQKWIQSRGWTKAN